MNTVLYDFPLSIFCQFVRVALAEKSVGYERREVDITRPQQQFEPGYLALNERGVVPTLVHNDELITNGMEIIRYVDERFEGPSLTPSGAELRREMNAWIERVGMLSFDVLFYDARRAGGPGVKGPQGRLAALLGLHAAKPSFALQERIDHQERLVVAVQDPAAVQRVVDGARQMLIELEAALADNRTGFVVGDAYSLADVVWTPTLARLQAHGLGLFADLPHVASYYERMKSRGSFEAAPVLDHITLASSPAPEPARAEIRV